jgi:response regulator of citrate/malate metabolism
MYEEWLGTNYVTDSVVEMLKEQPSQIKNYQQGEIKKFVKEKIATQDLSIDKETKRNIEDENVMHLLKGLDQEAHEKVMRKINMIMKEQKTSTPASTKRKMEKQDYYPAKR